MHACNTPRIHSIYGSAAAATRAGRHEKKSENRIIGVEVNHQITTDDIAAADSDSTSDASQRNAYAPSAWFEKLLCVAMALFVMEVGVLVAFDHLAAGVNPETRASLYTLVAVWPPIVTIAGLAIAYLIDLLMDRKARGVPLMSKEDKVLALTMLVAAADVLAIMLMGDWVSGFSELGQFWFRMIVWIIVPGVCLMAGLLLVADHEISKANKENEEISHYEW